MICEKKKKKKKKIIIEQFYRREQKQSEKREAREIGRERNLLVWTMNLSRLSDGANPVPESENPL